MRRDTKATWQSRGWPTRGAGGAQGADTWQEATRVHAGPRGHPCGVPRGRRVGIWRVHRLVGLGKYIGAVTQMRTAPLPFIRAILLRFLRVGLCSHGVLPLQDTWQPRGRWIHEMRSQNINRVDPIPRDRWWSTCVKSCISEMIDGRHVAHLGGVNLHQTEKNHQDFETSPTIRGSFQSARFLSDAWYSLDGRDRAQFRKSRDAAWTLRKALDPHRMDDNWWNEAILSGFIKSTRWWKSSSEENDRMVEKTRGRIPQSWRDRTAIAARLSRDCGAFGEIVAHDHATIDGPRLPRDRGHQSAPTTASNGPNFRAKISFKSDVFSLLVLQLLIDSWR